MLYRSVGGFDSLRLVFDVEGFRLSVIRCSKANSVRLEAGGFERLVFPLEGGGYFNGFRLEVRDMGVIPPGSPLEFSCDPGSTMYVVESPSGAVFEPFVRRLVEGRVYRLGGVGYRRVVNVMISEDDPLERLLAGYVEGLPGEWTSYPPHRHDWNPEAYIFYGIRGFAVQLVFDDYDSASAFLVRDHDVVLIERGYHPNFSTTLGGVNYAWVISARPGHRRLEAEVHPDFRGLGLGGHLKVKG